MASIIRRGNSYSVIYNYTTRNNETKQKWETRQTYKEALARKAEIEYQQHTDTFIPPNNQNLSDFMYDFVALYGQKKWGVSMYDSSCSLIDNYINPIIGNLKIKSITPLIADKYIHTLQKTPVATQSRASKPTHITNSTIEKIIKLLRCAFNQAVRWEIIARNPFEYVILPKVAYKKREIWTAETIRIALDNCSNSNLYIAINLAFACSLRLGEI